MNNKTTHTFHVHGMHCRSCELLIGESFKELPHIDKVQVSLSSRTITVTGMFIGDREKVADDLTELVRGHGYTISANKIIRAHKWNEFLYAVPIAFVIIAAFIELQKTGLTSFITSAQMSYGTAFFIGLIASVSSCLAIVGGLVLSFSANSAKEGGTWRSQALFHAGRIGGFFLLGGAVGFAGSTLHLGITATAILGGAVALVMLILGVNLLDVFHFTKKLQFALPSRFSRPLIRGTSRDHFLVPPLVGIGTFFLPCGFTQSMQLYALSTGSFTQGALTMMAFALGTFPMLALLSFGSLNIAHKPWKGVFFKTAGIIVITLALLNLSNALATLGIISPIISL